MNTITLTGNLTNDPELRYTPAGKPVCNLTVAVSNPTKDPVTGAWKDENPVFLRCTIWNQMAEQVAQSLTKGTRVMVEGQLQQRSYTDRNGTERTLIEMLVNDIGPSLRYATAEVRRTPRDQNTPQAGNASFAQPAMQPAQTPYPQAQASAPAQSNAFTQPAGGQAGDPWATQPALDYDAPPF